MPNPHLIPSGPRVRFASGIPSGRVTIGTSDLGDNLYVLDADTGAVTWQQRVGHHFCVNVGTAPPGLGAWGIDFRRPETHFLYLFNEEGDSYGRIACYGRPDRSHSRTSPITYYEGADNSNAGIPRLFAGAADGTWVAATGNFGVVLHEIPSGDVRWTDDWWQSERAASRSTGRVAALDSTAVVVAVKGEVRRLSAANGTEAWSFPLPHIGERFYDLDAAGGAVAVAASGNGGSIYILDSATGVLRRTFFVSGTHPPSVRLSPDGTAAVAWVGKHVRYLSTADGMVWACEGPGAVGRAVCSIDGRVFVSYDTGLTLVLDADDGEILKEWNFDCLTCGLWVESDLVIGAANGRVLRYDSSYDEVWETTLVPTLERLDPDDIAPVDETETYSAAALVNNADAGTPNFAASLFTQNKFLAQFVPGSDNIFSGRQLQSFASDPTELHDGLTSAVCVQLNAETFNALGEGDATSHLTFGTFNVQVRLDALGLANDPARPETWLNDADLFYWDQDTASWVYVKTLVSVAAHRKFTLTPPPEAAIFRLSLPPRYHKGFRLSEVAAYGQLLGCSHPDVQAGLDYVELIDERVDLSQFITYATDDPYSTGVRFARFTAAYGGTDFFTARPFGGQMPGWKFKVVQTPTADDEFRYVRFAWRRRVGSSPTGIQFSLRTVEFGRSPMPYAGDTPPAGEGNQTMIDVSDTVPTSWSVHTIDLWPVVTVPVTITGLWAGADLDLDHLYLGKTVGDLP